MKEFPEFMQRPANRIAPSRGGDQNDPRLRGTTRPPDFGNPSRINRSDMTPSAKARFPRWYGIPFRILLITFLGTLICFAVSLLLAIIGTVVVAALRGVHPDMRVAYRQVALPLGLLEAAGVLVFAVMLEARHYRQRKALAALERMS